MITLLADVNIQGHVARLAMRMQGETWREFWDHLQLRLATFAQIGLDPAASDAEIWQHCQQHGIILLTNNRNADGPTSLQATIQTASTPEILPVFTIGDADSILSDSDYADRVIDRLLRYLMEVDNIRGTGRLFLP